MRVNRKDVAAGWFFVAVALLYGGAAWRALPMGSALDMGPGYFPIILSGLLLVIGIVIVVRAFFTMERHPFGIMPWRAVIMLSIATIAFASLLKILGLLPGTFLTTFIATLSSAQIPVLRAAITSLCIAVFCTAVFGYAVKLPVPIFGSLFGM
jgi:putative tricarboxylic transport membrane protein